MARRAGPAKKGRTLPWPVIAVLALAVPLLVISTVTWRGLQSHSSHVFEHFPHHHDPAAAATAVPGQASELPPVPRLEPHAIHGGLPHRPQAGSNPQQTRQAAAAAAARDPAASVPSGNAGVKAERDTGQAGGASLASPEQQKVRPGGGGGVGRAAAATAAAFAAATSSGSMRALLSPPPLEVRYSDPFLDQVPQCKPLPTDRAQGKPLAYVADPRSPFPVNCKGFEELCAVVARVANPQREVMVAVANSAAPGLQGFLASIKKLRLSNFMVVALDQRLVSSLRQQGVNHYYSPNSAQGNHKVSAQKFGILRDFVHVGCSVLLTDTDVVYMQDPFPYLYRDSDVEGMSDGWDAPTAHGDLDPTDDPTLGLDNPARARDTLRIAALNSGLWFVRATYPSLRMMEIMSHRMATEDVWDQTGYNQELFMPSRDAHFGAGCTVRVLSSLCFLNSKVMFRYVRTKPGLRDSYLPVSMHANYHSDKPAKMHQVAEYYLQGNKQALDRCNGDGCRAGLVDFHTLEKEFRGIVNDGIISSRVWGPTKKLTEAHGCHPVPAWGGKLANMTHELSMLPAAGGVPGCGASPGPAARHLCEALLQAYEAGPAGGPKEAVVVFVSGAGGAALSEALVESFRAAAPRRAVVVAALDEDAACGGWGGEGGDSHAAVCAPLFEGGGAGGSGAEVDAPVAKWAAISAALQMGWSLLVADPDVVFLSDPLEHLYRYVVFLSDPLEHLYRDSDVEVATDGFDDNTAYGYDHVIDDATMGWSRFCHGTRMFTRDPGLVYLQATEASLRLARRVAGRLAGPGDRHVADRERRFFNQELWIPSHGAHTMVGVSVRVMNYFCWANSKAVASFMKNDPSFQPQAFKPVAVHLQYTPAKNKEGCARSMLSYYGRGNKSAMEGGPCHGSGSTLDPELCDAAREKPPPFDVLLRKSPLAAHQILSRAGGWAWAGHQGLVFQPDGALETPWGKGAWGVIKAGQSAAMIASQKLYHDTVFANFAGARHRLTWVPESGGYFISQRCGDGDIVLVRGGKAAHTRLRNMLK